MSEENEGVTGGLARSGCPIASTLDILGDKWSLVIVRDLFTGKQRFNEFAASPERIPTNLLSQRLRQLEEQGLVAKAPYQERPRRYAYTLTPAGRALLPILQDISRWANAHMPGTWVPPEAFMRMKPRM